MVCMEFGARQIGNCNECVLPLHVIQQLSQFWYDETTTVTLANEALRVAGDNGRYIITPLHVVILYGDVYNTL